MIPGLHSVIKSSHRSELRGSNASNTYNDFLPNYAQATGNVSLAEECFETPLRPRVQTSTLPPVGERSQDGRKDVPLSKVKLSKTSTPQLNQFYVRTGGGMSVSVPELSLDDSERSKEVPHFSEAHLYDHAENMHGSKQDPPQPNLALELVAGKGPSSLSESDSKSVSNPKPRNQLPSQTLANTASLFKWYLTSGTEKQQQSKSAGSTPEAELSVKTRMMGIWNNVRYGWTVNLKTNFSRDTPVYLMGRVYHRGHETDPQQDPSQVCSMEGFKRDFYSLVWCTYRRQFPILQGSSLTTDCGWGCMLRSGQMMLAHALTRHFLSRDWRLNKMCANGSGCGSLGEKIHRAIVKWFGDLPSTECPLSLHNLVNCGRKMGKKAGDWYGPASVAYIFKEAIANGSQNTLDLRRLCVYVAQDCAVYIQDVLDMCCTNSCLCNVGTLSSYSRTWQSRRQKRENFSQYSMESENNFSMLNDYYSEPSEPGKEPVSSQIIGDIKGGTVNSGSVVNEVMRKEDPSVGGERGPQSQGSVAGRPSVKPRTSGEQKPAGTTSAVSQAKQVNAPGLTEKVCSECEGWKSVIVLVPVRLGGEGLNPMYEECVRSLMTFDLCIGIIGGRPKHSLYFVGFQEDHLIHLDPHLCQDAAEVLTPDFPLHSYHCTSPRKMSLSRMDPSATIGFYCHRREDFYRLMEELPKHLTPSQPGCEYPIFEFLDGRSEDINAWSRQVTQEDLVAASLPQHAQLLPQDSQEFVIL
ncbi:cysteine protease ATG4D-like [Oratosquilla oratoria]|uniref:cysteine protease ATG4D-like n=1 Tax=Oratosquilla oratoria TaxID=337810 RepID=UPI003F772396